MTFQQFLNNRSATCADMMLNQKEEDVENRNANDYFFNKSDLDKMRSFKRLTENYKCYNKKYYFFNELNNIWIEEKTDDSVISRICDHARHILEYEEIFVKNLLNNKLKDYAKKEELRTLTLDDKDKMEELKKAVKDFNKFISKVIKDHMRAKFAKDVIKFFNHIINDNEFINKININNQHLLPLSQENLNLITLQMEPRTKEQYFTRCLKINHLQKQTGLFNFEDITIEDENYKTVDSFFLDIASGNEAKKEYLRKMLGYFISGNVANGRIFTIFYGHGRNGKSVVFELLKEILQDFYAPVESSIIVKRGVKNAGQASPEVGVLDFGLRLACLSETDDGDKLNESLIKNISGYDAISYRPLYGDPKKFTSEAKLCMLTNNKPYFKLSESMVDRLRFISFNSRFISENEMNQADQDKKKNLYIAKPELVNKLKTDLIQYVLFWIALGSKKFFEEKHMEIPNDETLKRENMSYINEMDSFKRFVESCLIIDSLSKTGSKVVKEYYKKFCSEEGIPAMQPKELKILLDEKFGPSIGHTRLYEGFRINHEINQITTDQPTNDQPQFKDEKPQEKPINKDEEEYKVPDPEGLDM